MTYPSERAKGRLPTFTKIHPQCLNRIFIDPRYEGSVKLELCHAEFQKEPITVSTVPSILGDSKQWRYRRPASIKRSKLDHHLPNVWTGTRGSISLTLFHKFPDGIILSSIVRGVFRSRYKFAEGSFLRWWQ